MCVCVPACEYPSVPLTQVAVLSEPKAQGFNSIPKSWLSSVVQCQSPPWLSSMVQCRSPPWLSSMVQCQSPPCCDEAHCSPPLPYLSASLAFTWWAILTYAFLSFRVCVCACVFARACVYVCFKCGPSEETQSAFSASYIRCSSALVFLVALVTTGTE